MKGASYQTQQHKVRFATRRARQAGQIKTAGLAGRPSILRYSFSVALTYPNWPGTS